MHVTAGGKEVAQLAPDGQLYWLHTDHLGTPRRMTNASGVAMYRGEFDPHGNVLYEWSAIGNPNLNNKKFTGYERDTVAGLDYAQARHYAYGRGRFVQPDRRKTKWPVPQYQNLYSYVGNDPVNFRDPQLWYWYQVSETYGYWDSTLCRDDRSLPQPEMPSDTGGIGGGGADLPSYLDQLINQLENIGEDCISAFGGKDKIDKWIDRLRKNEVQIKNHHQPTSIPNHPQYKTVAEYWDKSVDTVTGVPLRYGEYGATVISGQRFDSAGKPDPNGRYNDAAKYNLIIMGPNPLKSTLLHEFLHWESRGGHLALADKLPLTARGYNFEAGNDSSAASALREFLENDCKPR